MENASKALIIAGAILLSILIIGLGMLVFNQAREALSGANLDAEKADAFNQKFTAYEGSAVRGSQVRSLLDTIRNNNTTLDANTTDAVQIKVTLVNGATTTVSDPVGANATYLTKLAEIKNAITLSGNYTVETVNYVKGFVSEMKITKN